MFLLILTDALWDKSEVLKYKDDKVEFFHGVGTIACPDDCGVELIHALTILDLYIKQN